MRLGLVMHPYGEKQPSGLGTSILDLARTLIESDEKNTYRIFLKGRKGRPEFHGAPYEVTELPASLFWMEGLRRFDDVDVFLFFMPVMPLFFRPRRSVVIARDFGYEHIPPSSIREWLNSKILHFVNAIAFRRATRIAAISEATKRELLERFSIDEEKVVVIPDGHRGFSRVAEEEMPTGEAPFFLFVGVLKARKNIERLLEAFALFKRTDKSGHQLLLAGKHGGEYGKRLEAYVKREGLSDAVRFLGYRSDGELAFLYKRAGAFVFPSLLEGFGKPVIEAMDCGTPVITSNEGALAEVADDAALLVNPRDPSDVAAAMRRLADDSALRQELIEKGRKRAAQFSWEGVAMSFEELFDEIRI